MNIGFFDPISERWIKPMPNPEPESPPCMSMGEALLAAVEAKAREERNARIWEYLRQSAEGCNSVPVSESAPIVTSDPPEYVQPIDSLEPIMVMQERLVFTQGGPAEIEWSGIPVAVEPPPEYEAVESLGYVYWRKKETA